MPTTIPKELSNPEVIYFPFPGRAEQIRLVLHMGGIEFQDKRVSWTDFKGENKMCYPCAQLPVMKVGDTMVCQSQALLIYAGRKAGLMPDDAETELLVNQLLCASNEMETKCFSIFFNPDLEERKKKMKTLLEDTLPFSLKCLDEMIEKFGDGAGHCVGTTLTVADINIYTSLSWLCFKGGEYGIPKDLCAKYSNITKVMEVVADHPKVKEWNAKA